MSNLHVIGGAARNMTGWQKELPVPAGHHRELSVVALGSPEPLPEEFDLDLFDQIPVYDQGRHGTCGSNMGAAAYLYQELKHGGSLTKVSRRFLHAMVNHIEGAALSGDTGVQIRDVLLALLRFGIPREDLCPYSDDPKPFTVEPSDEAKADAQKHKAVLDYRCPSVESIKGALFLARAPVNFGFTCFESFRSDHTSRTGEVSYPEPGEKIIGGHANLIRGWKTINGTRCFRTRNSYGENFGAGGDLYVPELFFEDGIASDCWALVTVELPS